MISALKTKKFLDSGCMRFLETIVDPSKETELTLDDVLVVKYYVSIFLKDLLRLLPDREIVFIIELVSGTAPISQLSIGLRPLS